MIKGKQIVKKHYLSADEILVKTNGGYDIYRYYLGKVERIRNRPWGDKGRRASWGIFPSIVWLWKDYITGETGNALSFVEKYFGLSNKEARDKVCWDFGFSTNETPNISPIKITWEEPTEEEKKPVSINFTTCPFDDKHTKYWNNYHLSEDYLKKYNVFRVKSLAINRTRVSLSKDELTFAYYHQPTDAAKIMRIGVEPDKKWRNNVSGDILWFKEYLKECNKLVISKSVKDSLCLSLFDINTVAVQSEGVSCVDKNIDWLKEINCPIYIAFGTDKQGKETSHIITKKYKYKHYNTPDYALDKGANDIAEFIKIYGMGEMEKHLKLKGII